MSARSVSEKLLVKAGGTLWLSDPTFADRLGPLPAGVGRPTGPAAADVAVVVAPGAAPLRAILDEHATALSSVGALWVAYPKGNRSDVNRDSLWPILAEYGLRPITQVAVDDTWSALRFRPLAPGEPPFTGGR